MQNTIGPTHYPVRLGVDDNRLFRDLPPAHIKQLFELLELLGISHVDIHLWLSSSGGNPGESQIARRFARIDELMREHDKTYTFNVELPNFHESLEITPGVNEFDQPGGLHRWDLRMEWLKPLLPPAAPAPLAFQGIVYDECEHMQLSNNKYANPASNFDQPFLVNTHGLNLETAFEQLVAACQKLRQEHYEGRVPLHTEQVWPDLFHIFARGGWTICPKILKEGLSSVTMSVALGAALQYADRTRFYVSPDLWRIYECPGHSVEALRSALLMAYWLGAETIYVESLSYSGTEIRHPDAVTPGMLAYEPDDGPYQVTAYGRVFRDFAREYVPRHPRPVTWRDYRPRVAIVRLSDGGWGQSHPNAAKGEEYPSRDRLLGNREHPLDEAASEWLHVWPVLTHQVARPGAISIFDEGSYPERRDFFVPIDSVAVFDHLVEGPALDSVECFVVCGHALSAATFKAIQARVEQGATCLIARRLYDQHAHGQPAGNMIVVDSFKDPAIAHILAPFVGPPDVARFRFAHHVVEFTKGAGPDRIEVKMTHRARAACR